MRMRRRGRRKKNVLVQGDGENSGGDRFMLSGFILSKYYITSNCDATPIGGI
jgi:hypothetical protein